MDHLVSIKAIGIDISKRSFDVAFYGEKIVTSHVYDKSGMLELLRRIKPIKPERIVMEATGGYERKLVQFLQKHGLPVVVENPKRIRDFAKASGVLAKTDRIDALVIANYAAILKPAVQAPVSKVCRGSVLQPPTC